MVKRFSVFSVFLLSVGVLVGCSSCGGEENVEPVATGVGDVGTAFPRSSSSGGGSSGSVSGSGVSSAGGVSSSGGGSGVLVDVGVLSDEERVRFESGEYVAASDRHPALNVPVPVMPEKAKERTVEGATAFIKFWTEAVNYCMQTGQCELAEQNTSTTNDYMSSHFELYDELEKQYSEGNWVVGNEYSYEPNPETFHEMGENGLIEAKAFDAAGAVYDKEGNQTEKLEESDYHGSPISLEVQWNGNQWLMYDLSGIIGADYGNK